MTKEEAMGAFEGISEPRSFGASAWIDRFVALGILKLDPPVFVSRSSPDYKAYDALFEHVPTLDFLPFKKLIEGAGLKIVEK